MRCMIYLAKVPRHRAHSRGCRVLPISALLLIAACAPQASTDGDIVGGSTPRPPIAGFVLSATRGSAPLTVQFTDTSSEAPTSWAWDFNSDGFVDSTQQNPVWTFVANFTYSVAMVATNAEGSGSIVRSNIVFVSPQPNPQLDMAPIDAGVFLMGSNAGYATEQPAHQVALTRPFWMAKFEVTQADYLSVMSANPSYHQGFFPGDSSRPVEQVSWSAARAYCSTLTALEQAAGRVPAGYQYRLPTEAEWEYCCRAGTTTEWHTGSSLSINQANFGGALAAFGFLNGQTGLGGSYAPNAFGLYDMHGNVFEWCLDNFELYSPAPTTNPLVTGGSSSASRVVRGGGWHENTDASDCRSARRVPVAPTSAFIDVGFRIVLAPILLP
jgi:formylglycine-generating enzyme required for sulfatase activity